MRTLLILGAGLAALLAPSGCATHLHSPEFGANGMVPTAEVPSPSGRFHPGRHGPGLVGGLGDFALIADLR